MVKRFCDRCGKEITPPKKPKKLKCAMHYMNFGLLDRVEEVPMFEYEICPECAEQLFAWIEPQKDG